MHEVTVTITHSSHPDFELFLDARFGARQMSRRGSRAEIHQLTKEIVDAAVKRGDVLLTVDDQTV